MKPFDSIVLSSDLNPKYIEFWPLVARAWKRLFNVQVHLALVAEPVNLYLESFVFSRIHFLKPVDGVPLANQAKVARYYVAAMFPDDHVVSTNDIDLLPLKKKHVERLCGNRGFETLITVGAELYNGVEAGKFTAGYLTGEAKLFRHLFDVGTKTWEEFVRGFEGLHKFDAKEDITNRISNEHPDCFSDESLLRCMLDQHSVQVDHRKAYHYPQGMLCRSNWPVNLEIDKYEDVHLPRPLHEHRELVYPLAQYLGLT